MTPARAAAQTRAEVTPAPATTRAPPSPTRAQPATHAPATAALTPVPNPGPAQPVTDVDAAALRPSRWPLAVGVAAVVALLVVGALVLARPDAPAEGAPPGPVVQPPPPVAPTPAVQPAPPPPAPQVKLTFTSNPERVEVFEDDVLLGTTPLTLTRAQGSVTSLRFEARGHAPLTRKLRFESDTTVPVALEKLARPKTRPSPPPPGEGLEDNPF